MRLRAYKKAIDEAKKLPNQIMMLDYFSNHYSPLDEAISHIISMARVDKQLIIDELVDLYSYKNEN